MKRDAERILKEGFRDIDELGDWEGIPSMMNYALRDWYGINLPSQFKLLEMGAGKGLFIPVWRNKLDTDAYGVDIRDDVHYEGGTFFKEDARNTHFPNDFFDVVVEHLMVEEIKWKTDSEVIINDILREAKRVLKPGGSVLFHPRYYMSGELQQELGFNQRALLPKYRSTIDYLHTVYTL